MRNNNHHDAIIITSIIAGVILIIALVAISTFGNPGNDKMTVQGTSTIKVMPNIVSVHFKIFTKGITSSEASGANTKIYNKFENALINQGFSKKDMETENFNVRPNFYYENGKQKIDGFIASHLIRIQIPSNETSTISLVVDDGINAGAGINYINFELSPELQTKYKVVALEEASKDAKIKANAVAKGFGKSIGKLLEVKVDNYNYHPWMLYQASNSANGAEARNAVASINPTNKDVTAIISATYKII